MITVTILCATAAMTTIIRVRVNAGVVTPGESPGYSLAGGLILTQTIHRRQLYFSNFFFAEISTPKIRCNLAYVFLYLFE